VIHLTPQRLSSYMDGELVGLTELVRRHMGACEECTLKFAQLEIQEDLLSKALVHDPGDEFFEQFTEAVGKQIPMAKGSSKPGPARPPSKNAPTAPLPSRLAMSRRAPEPSAPAPSGPAPEDAVMRGSEGAMNDWTSTADADEELVGEAETPTRDMETSHAARRVDVSGSVRRGPDGAADPMDSPDSPRAFEGSRGDDSTRETVGRRAPSSGPPRGHAATQGSATASRLAASAGRTLDSLVRGSHPAAISASVGVMVRARVVSAWLDSVAPRAGSARVTRRRAASPRRAPSQAPSQAPTEEMVPAPNRPRLPPRPP
jgi:hypothetical protein